MADAFDLFISYVSEDRVIHVDGQARPLIVALKRTLEEHRHPDDTMRRFRVCTYEEDFELGDAVKATIETQVQCSTAILIVASRRAAARPLWIEYEWSCFRRKYPAARPIGAWVDGAPAETFPNIFTADDLLADLRPGGDIGVWEQQLLSATHRIVAHVWRVPLSRVHDRFVDERHAAERAAAAHDASALAIRARTAWDGDDVARAFRLAHESWKRHPNLAAQKVLFQVRESPLQGKYSERFAATSVHILPCGSGFVASHGQFEKRPGYAIVRSFDARLKARIETEDQVTDVVIAPDERHLVTRAGWGFGHTEAHVWGVPGGHVGTLTHDDTIEDIVFMPDGECVFSGGADGTARLWNLAGQELLRLRDMFHVAGVDCSPDGSLLATASWDGSVRLWRRDGRLVRRLHWRDDKLMSVTFVNQGRWVVATEYRFRAYLWTVDGELLDEFECAGDEHPPGIAVQGRWVASGLERLVKLYDLRETRSTLRHQWRRVSSLMQRRRGDSAQPLATPFRILNASQNVDSVHLSGDGSIAVVRCNLPTSRPKEPTRGSIEIWTTEGQRIAHLSHPARVTGADVSANGKTIVSSCEDGAVRVYRIDEKPAIVLDDAPHVNDFRFLRDGDGVVAGYAGGQVRVYGTDGSVKNAFQHEDHVAYVAVDGRQCVLLGGHTHTATLRTLAGEAIARFEHPKHVALVGFSPDDELVVTAAYNTAYVWKRSGALVAVLSHPDGGVLSYASFSPDGQHILTAGLDKTGARLWSTRGTLIAVLGGDDGVYVASASFLHGGQMVVTKSLGAMLWDWAARPVRRLAKYANKVIVTSLDEIVVVPPSESTAALLDMEGAQVAEFLADGTIESVQASSDGLRFLVATDKALTIWDRTGTRLAALHKGRVSMVRVSQRGGYVAAMAYERDRLMVWGECSPDAIVDAYQPCFPTPPGT